MKAVMIVADVMAWVTSVLAFCNFSEYWFTLLVQKNQNIYFWHSLKEWGCHYAQDSKFLPYAVSHCAATETLWNVTRSALCAPKCKFAGEGVAYYAEALRLSSMHYFKLLYGSSSSQFCLYTST